MTRSRSIWCSVTSALSPPRPDLHTVMETSAWVHILIFIPCHWHHPTISCDCMVMEILKIDTKNAFYVIIIECIGCNMQYAIFDQNWEQNNLNSIAFLWIFLLSPVPTRHQKNISNIHACASPRIVTVSMSGVSCVGVWCVFMLQLFLLYLDNIYNIYV